MSSDYTAIYNLLEEAEKHKQQMKIHEDHYTSLTKTAQAQCAHPATMKRRSQEELTYKCMVCHKQWGDGRATE